VTISLWSVALAVLSSIAVTLFGAIERSALTDTPRQTPWISTLIAVVITIALTFTQRGQWWQIAGIGGVVGASIAIAAIDWQTHLIPDRLQIIGAGFALLTTLPNIDKTLFGIANGFAIAGVLFAITMVYEKFRGKTGLGMGDIKLFAWAGLVCQQYTFLAVALSSVLAIPFAIANIRQPHKPFPFGPCIVLSMLIFQPLAT
jgi:leader peptidase (prepilin peptidase)/N-methyltransferase